MQQMASLPPCWKYLKMSHFTKILGSTELNNAQSYGETHESLTLHFILRSVKATTYSFLITSSGVCRHEIVCHSKNFVSEDITGLEQKI